MTVVALPFAPTACRPVMASASTPPRCADCQSPAIREIVGTIKGKPVAAYRCGTHAPPLIHGYDLYDVAMRPTGTVGRP